MERKIEEQLLAWKNKTDDRLPLIVNKSDDCILF